MTTGVTGGPGGDVGGRRRVTGVPRLPAAAVGRPRLLAALDRAATGPLTLLVGAPGVGRSVLLAQWAAARTAADPGGATVWLTVDPGTAGRRDLWTSLLPAIVDAVPVAGPRAVALAEELVAEEAPSTGRPPGGLPTRWRHRLVQAAADLGTPVTVVLDDVHHVTDPDLVDDLVAVLGTTPDLHLVASGRGRVLLDDERVRQRLDAVVLGPADLVLTPAETAAVVSTALGRRVPAARLRDLHAAVGGHPASVVAAARAGARLAEERPALVTDAVVPGPGGGRELEAVLVGAAVEHVARVVRELWGGDARFWRFLRTASVVDDVPGDLVRHLWGGDDAAELLVRAVEEGAGEWTGRADGATGTVTWYPVVGAALRDDLHRTEPEHARLLLRAAGHWAVDHDRPVTALDAGVRLQDPELLGTVARRWWGRLLGRHAAELAPLLTPLPRRVAAVDPVVLALTAAAWSSAGLHHAKALPLHRATLAGLDAALATAGAAERAFLLAVEVRARRQLGDVEGALTAADRVGDALAALTTVDRDLLAGVAFVHQQTGVTAALAGDLERALTAFAEAHAAAEGVDHDEQQAEALLLSALVHALGGEVRTAETLVAQADGRGPIDRLVRACVALESGRPRDALDLLGEINPVFGSFEHWPLVLGLRARAAAQLGPAVTTTERDEFERLVRRHGGRSTVGGVLGTSLGLARVRTALALGQVQRARDLLDDLPDTPRVTLERAVLHLVQGDARRAHGLAVTTLLREAVDGRLRVELHLVRAVAELRLGDVAAARETFVGVVDQLWRTGQRAALLVVPGEDLAALVEFAAAAGHDRARTVVADVAGLTGAWRGEHGGAWLSERELVVLRAVAGGGSLPEVARSLHVSVNTVKTQLRSTYRKLGVGDRREAVRAAEERGLLTA